MRVTQPFLIALLLLSSSTGSKSQEWREIGRMPVPVAGGVALALNDRIVILGGYSDSTASALDLIQIYDPLQGSWQRPGRLENPRYAFVADLYKGGVIVCGGGTDTREASGSNALELWSGSDAAPAPSIDDNPMINRLYATGGVFGENLYLFGGSREPANWVRSAGYILVYNIEENTLSTRQDSLFTDQIPYQQMSVFDMGICYLFGGVHFGISKTVYVYDTARDRFSRIEPPLRQARAAGAAVKTAPGQYMLLGGYNETRDALASTEIYEIANSEVRNRLSPAMNRARKELMAAFFQGSIYVFGGRDQTGEIVPSVECLEWTDGQLTPVRENDPQPSDFVLDPAYPNPFNSRTTIAFTLSRRAQVVVEIVNLAGQVIRTLLHGERPPGRHSCVWDANSAPSGLYLVRLTAGHFQVQNKMMLIK